MDGLWGPILGAVGIIVAALLTFFATRGKDKTGGVNAYIDQLQKDREDDRMEHRLQKQDWIDEREKLIKDFTEEVAQIKAAFVVERNDLRTELNGARTELKDVRKELTGVRAELDAALADVRKLRQQIAEISVVRTIDPTKEDKP